MNRERLLQGLGNQSKEDRLLLARALDKGERSARGNLSAHTGFLNQREAALAETMLSRWEGCPRHLFFGGYQGAERNMLFFLPDYRSAEEAQASSLVIGALQTALPPGSGLSHRDFLGALMGMGIARETIGDILVDETLCTLFLQREVLSFLQDSMEMAGKYKIQWKEADLSSFSPPVPKTRIIRDTVAALRLDAVVSSGFSISRNRAAGLIAAGQVFLGHLPCRKPDRPVREGDLISARGFGRFSVREAGGASRKGRIFVVLERFM
ncbi:MAG: YlmH/Sll1252 family protein [Oscillospiraceae bacterium]|nr:YlmH/Sll1252 family protein [Oscillospiraceae bacterium]